MKAGIVRIFVVEYQKNGEKHLWEESLTAAIAMALGKELARRGMRPTVRKMNMTCDEAYRRTKRVERSTNSGDKR